MPPRAFVPSLLTIGLVVSVISSLGAPFIPTIAEEMDASLGAAQWSLTATLLVGAIVSPVLGRLGDGPHRRAVLLGGLGVVTVGGALAALAQTLEVLVAGRALQGVGLALMPLTMASARDHLPREQAGRTIATLSVIAAVGVGLGYPITGLIAERFDAGAAFAFGAAFSALALVLAALHVPAASVRTRPPGLDVRGAVLIGGGLLALLVACERGADWGWRSASTLGLLAAAVVLLAAWTRNELRVAHPLVELRLVRRPAVLTANATGLVLGTSMYLGIALVTQVVQRPDGIGASVFVSGLTLLPLSAGSAVSTRLLPRVEARLGRRSILPAGAIVIATAMVLFATTADALWEAFVAMGLVGLGVGFTFAAMPTLIVGSVPADETSSAMSFYQVSRYVGFSIGSGLAVTLLRAFSGGADVPTADAYSQTFGVGAVLCLAAAVLAWLMSPGSTTRPARRPGERAEAASAGVPAT